MKRITILLILLLACGCQTGPKNDRLTGVWADDKGNTVEFVAPNAVLWIAAQETVRSGKVDGERYREKTIYRSVRVGFYSLSEDQAEIQWARGQGRTRGTERTHLKLGPEGSQILKFTAVPEPKGKEQSYELTRATTEVPAELVGIWKNSVPGRIEGRILGASGVLVDIGQFGGSKKGGRVSRAEQYQVVDQALVVKDLNFNHRYQKPEETHWMLQNGELKFLDPWALKQNKSFSDLKPFTRQSQPLRFTEHGRVQWPSSGD